MAAAALDSAWKQISTSLDNGDHVASSDKDTLLQIDAIELFESYYRDRFRARLRNVIIPEFIKRLDGCPQDEEGCADVLSKAVCTLKARLCPILDAAQFWVDTDVNRGTSGTLVAYGNMNLMRSLQSTLEAEFRLPILLRFRSLVLDQFKTSFSNFVALQQLRDDHEEVDRACETDVLNSGTDLSEHGFEDAAELVSRLRNFRDVTFDLDAIGLLSLICTSSGFSSLVEELIVGNVTSICRGEYEESFVAALESWLTQSFHGWLDMFTTPTARAATPTLSPQHVQARLYHTLCRLRIDELFDIIVDYPDSHAAITDLQTCLQRIADTSGYPVDNSGYLNPRTYLLQSLTATFRRRLLHPGANTNDILTQYILAIKALRELDPSGVVLEVVCAPVREYLQGRDDTIRSIVTSLIDDSNSDLSSELADGKPIAMADSDASSDESDSDADDVDDSTGTRRRIWMPDPVDAAPLSSRSQRTGDVTSLLINIYGSKELFVKEYRQLLSERLLALDDYDVIDREARHLELLKLRFGEEHMTQCDVMLKDITDSKRISTRIEEDAKGTPEGEAISANGGLRILILSRLFWPSFKGEDALELPARLQRSIDAFTRKYEVLKAARTLDIKKQLGYVSVDIELDSGKTMEFRVPPVVATIILHFEDTPKWTLEALSSTMKVSTAVIQKRILFWTRQGLIKQISPGEYMLDEQGYATADNTASSAANAMQDAEDGDDDDGDDDGDETQMCWQFIEGMLANHPSLPVDRIHAFLSMFMEGGFDMTEQQLKKFLDSKVEEGTLAYSGGEFKLAAS